MAFYKEAGQPIQIDHGSHRKIYLEWFEFDPQLSLSLSTLKIPIVTPSACIRNGRKFFLNMGMIIREIVLAMIRDSNLFKVE